MHLLTLLFPWLLTNAVCKGRRIEKEPETCRGNYRVVSRMCAQFLRHILHIYVFSRPIVVRQCYGNRTEGKQILGD
jgi:hypothetical protein